MREAGLFYAAALFMHLYLTPEIDNKIALGVASALGLLAFVFWKRLPKFFRCYMAVAISTVWSSVAFSALNLHMTTLVLDGPCKNMLNNIKRYSRVPDCLVNKTVQTAKTLRDNFLKQQDVQKIHQAALEIAETAKEIHDNIKEMGDFVKGIGEWLQSRGFSCEAAMSSSRSPVHQCRNDLYLAKTDCYSKRLGKLCDVVDAANFACDFIQDTMTKTCTSFKNKIKQAFSGIKNKLATHIGKLTDFSLEIHVFGNQTKDTDFKWTKWKKRVDRFFPDFSWVVTLFHVFNFLFSHIGLIYFFVWPLCFVTSYNWGSLDFYSNLNRKKRLSVDKVADSEKLLRGFRWKKFLVRLLINLLVGLVLSLAFFLDWMVAFSINWLNNITLKLRTSTKPWVVMEMSSTTHDSGVGRIYRIMKEVINKSSSLFTFKNELFCFPRKGVSTGDYTIFVICFVALIILTALNSLLANYPLVAAGHYYPQRRRQRTLYRQHTARREEIFKNASDAMKKRKDCSVGESS